MNTTDVGTLVPLVDRLRNRFGIKKICIVADRGLITHENLANLKERGISYILDAQLDSVNEVKRDLLSICNKCF